MDWANSRYIRFVEQLFTSLYILHYGAQSNENWVQQSSAKIQECKNLQTKVGNTIQLMAQSFSGQEIMHKEKVKKMNQHSVILPYQPCQL